MLPLLDHLVDVLPGAEGDERLVVRDQPVLPFQVSLLQADLQQQLGRLDHGVRQRVVHVVPHETDADAVVHVEVPGVPVSSYVDVAVAANLKRNLGLVTYEVQEESITKFSRYL